MGLDAHVRCNCAKEGKAKPFPVPGKLTFDECGEPHYPTEELTPEQLLACDRWGYDWGCKHHGYLVKSRIGNVSLVAYVSEQLEAAKRRRIGDFAILLSKVVYSGSHAGDCLTNDDAQLILAELQALKSLGNGDKTIRDFAATMHKLCEASIASGNHIMF
jgi:hypothetical protein